MIRKPLTDPTENKLYCRVTTESIKRFARIADRYGYTRSSLLRLLVEATIEGDISIPRILEKRHDGD